jgi:hypothetical protein
MTLTTKLLSALVFLVLLAPAYSGLLSTGQASTSHAVAYNTATTAKPAIKAMTADAYQRADALLSVKNSTTTVPALTAIDKQAIS